MFEVEKPVFINKPFRFEKQFLEEIEIVAQQNKISVNALVIQCCKYALSNMKENVSYKEMIEIN